MCEDASLPFISSLILNANWLLRSLTQPCEYQLIMACFDLVFCPLKVISRRRRRAFKRRARPPRGAAPERCVAWGRGQDATKNRDREKRGW